VILAILLVFKGVKKNGREWVRDELREKEKKLFEMMKENDRK